MSILPACHAGVASASLAWPAISFSSYGMSLTTDPNDPDLTRGVDTERVEQAKKYLVLSEGERAKGFVRPVRHSYRHVGPAGPKYPLRDLTEAEMARYSQFNYFKFEAYPDDGSSVCGKFWTQTELDSVGKGCGTLTTMGTVLAETYARDPAFYGSTYCCSCQMHRPVSEFVWEGTTEIVGS